MYTLLTLIVQINGQILSADVTKDTIQDVLESWLRMIYEAPTEYTCDYWAVYTVDKCHYRNKFAEVYNEPTRYCIVLESGGNLPSRRELEDCFTTGPFMGRWVRLEEGVIS